jgi:hypothetical protein
LPKILIIKDVGSKLTSLDTPSKKKKNEEALPKKKRGKKYTVPGYQSTINLKKSYLPPFTDLSLQINFCSLFLLL